MTYPIEENAGKCVGLKCIEIIIRKPEKEDK